jgi:AraC-like DNA-binding protein
MVVKTSMGTELPAPVRELVSSPPAPGLRGIVVEYRGFRDDAPAPVVQREPPSACVPVVIDLGAGWHVAAPAEGYRRERLRGFAAGMHDSFALVEAAGPALGVQVDLSPIGARRLLGVPMHELKNRVVPLDDLLGREAGALRERLGEARCWGERFAIIDGVLATRLENARTVSPGVEWAWARLEVTGGAVPIGALARELDWSRKRLIARFRDEIGLTPKRAARVLRFQALLGHLRAGRVRGWADLAVECGYADQSHLVHDVRRFAGVAPTQLLAAISLPRREGDEHRGRPEARVATA